VARNIVNLFRLGCSSFLCSLIGSRFYSLKRPLNPTLTHVRIVCLCVCSLCILKSYNRMQPKFSLETIMVRGRSTSTFRSKKIHTGSEKSKTTFRPIWLQYLWAIVYWSVTFRNTHLSLETVDSGGGPRPSERSSTMIHVLNTSIIEESGLQ
jgi:hypothetical protein